MGTLADSLAPKPQRGARLKDQTGHDVKVLTIDIENRPAVVYSWGMFKQSFGLDQVVQPPAVMGVGYKWYHEPTAQYLSEFKHGRLEMLTRVKALIEEADIVVGYNSAGFDMKHLRTEFLKAGLGPLREPRQVDLLLHVRKKYRFFSNKLDFVCQELGLGGKMSHEGMMLWVKCMDGDVEAQERMASYCRRDVMLTEALYDEVRGEITNHPHVSMFTGSEWGCPQCGETDISTHRKGEAYTNVQRYPIFQCPNCGAWVRSTRKLNDATRTRHAL